MRGERLLAAVISLVLVLTGCYRMRSSAGGGQIGPVLPVQRPINAGDVALPPGYRIEVIARDLTFPTGIAFDDRGRPHAIEAGYSYGDVFTTPRLLRIEQGGLLTQVAEGEGNGPWNGLVFHDGGFYVAEGGQLHGGAILRISPDGKIQRVVEGLPGMGDHHTNGPAIGPGGMVYFGQGTATNSAVVGTDNAEFGWLKRRPDFHDIPCRDITLAGVNYESPDVVGPDPGRRVRTGAFVPFGTATEKGQVVRGRVPCNGAIMRVAAGGGKPELVAWGFRNPFGLAFSPDGDLYVTDNGYDDRGSRPVWGAGDLLWQVRQGTWYGWPDYSGSLPLTLEGFKPPGKDPPRPVLAGYPNEPPRPAAVLGVHAAATGIDFSRSDRFGYAGQAFIAELGDMAPATGKVLAPVGFRVVRVDVSTGVVHDFAVNKGTTNGPASWLKSGGLERPVAVRFDPQGESLYVADFGIMRMTERGALPQKGTGVVWRIGRAAP